ncbi:flagellar hook-length control protein FliK [Jeotgalibacillus marinus]|uniref:Flagellar hook-length control protein FliK n=1 Tax=Jeotgalibacillus marinus TaxID=86667 RepID=A0ABV3Q1U6_9BACL
MDVLVNPPKMDASISKLGGTANEMNQATDQTQGFGQVMAAVAQSTEKSKLDSGLSKDDVESVEKTIQELLNLLGTESMVQFGVSPEEIMSLDLPGVLEKLNLSQDMLHQLLGQTASSEVPNVKIGNPESMVWLSNFAEKVAQLPSIKLLTPTMQEAIAALKGITLAVQSTDGPAAQSTVAASLSKTLLHVEEKLVKLQEQMNAFKTPVTKNDLNWSGMFQKEGQTSEGSSEKKLTETKAEVTSVNLQSLQLQSSHGKWSLAVPVKSNEQATSLMQQFQTIMSSAKFGKANGTEKLMIRLQPEHLGTLRIELVQKAGILTARVMTSTGIAKEMMDSQLHQLRQSLTSQNIQVEKIEVLNMESESNRSERQMDQSSQQSSQQKEQEKDEHLDDDQDEEQSFHQIFLNIEV